MAKGVQRGAAPLRSLSFPQEWGQVVNKRMIAFLRRRQVENPTPTVRSTSCSQGRAEGRSPSAFFVVPPRVGDKGG